jgi:serine-type D-Ala-D-Ala carboxypeptidase (penicillin-binding protein 5/6)
MLKRLLAGALLLPLLFGAAAHAAKAVKAKDPLDHYKTSAAAYAMAVDDQIVWGRAMDTPRPPASLTKLLSALVILDHRWQPDATVTVSAQAASVEGSHIGLRAGEQVRAGDLLTGMIVRSGNDACMAMAEHVGGNVGNFVRMMNAKAQQLGMTRSSFRNPCGLDAEGHVSTAHDLLLLARAAADRPEIASRANETQAEIRTLGGRRIHFKNTNAILGREPDVAGLKTGFTRRAGKCLIAMAERGAHRVWVVLLHAPDRWTAASGLLAKGMALAEHQALGSLAASPAGGGGPG